MILNTNNVHLAEINSHIDEGCSEGGINGVRGSGVGWSKKAGLLCTMNKVGILTVQVGGFQGCPIWLPPCTK